MYFFKSGAFFFSQHKFTLRKFQNLKHLISTLSFTEHSQVGTYLEIRQCLCFAFAFLSTNVLKSLAIWLNYY